MPIYGTFRKRLAPTAPSGLNSPSQTTTSISLAWTNSHAEGAADEILVFQDGVVIAELGGGATAYTVMGLSPGETHLFRVAAANGEGSSATADLSVSATSGSAPTITAQPMDKSVEDGAAVNFQVIAANALGYQWQRSTDGGSIWADISGAAAPYYTLTATTAANGYQYRCTASNDFGETTSSAATLTVTAASGLTAVSDLAAALASDSQADLTWTDQSAGETAYRVYRDGSLIHTTAANASSYSDTGATPGATHVYRVDVTDGTNTLAGNEVTVTMAGPQIASSPTDEWIPDGGTAVFGVAMAPDQGTVTYQWQVSTDSGDTWSNVGGATSAYYEASFAAADNGKLYRCQCTTGAGTVTSESALLTVYAHEHHHDTNAVLEGWGFRKIRAAYAGDCCQIRDSGGTTHNIGWSGGKVDQSALETAAGGARATLVKLYGQGPLGVEIDFTGAEPYITDAAGNLLTEDGVPYWQGVGDETYASADFTGNEIDGDNIALAMLFRFDFDAVTDTSGQASKHLLTFGGSATGLAVSTQLSNIVWRTSGNQDIGAVNTSRFSWLTGYSNGEAQDFFQGGNPCGVTRIGDSSYAPIGSGHAAMNVGTLKGMRCSEIVLWAACSRAQLDARMLLCDRNYCVGPRDLAYRGVYPITKPAYKLCQWLAAQRETDFQLPSVTSKTETTVTIGGVDWSWVPSGRQLKLGTETGGADLTVQSAAFSGGNTTFFVSESTASVTTGMECRVDPWWDGVTTDTELAAEIALNWRSLSNTSRDMEDVGGNQTSSGFPPEWYSLQGDGDVVDLTPSEQAIIDAGAPGTPGLTGGISDDGAGQRALLLRFDLSGLVARPDTAWLRVLDMHVSNDGLNSSRQISAAVKVYEDLIWTAATVTWNTSPVVLSPKPVTWDDDGALEQRLQERTFDLTNALREAYDAGAASVTVAVYVVNDIEGEAPTTREAEIREVDLRVAYSRGQNIPGCARPLQLDYQPDATHHYGWGNEMLARFHDSLPLADGRNGQPFYHNLAMLRRGLAVNFMGFIRRLIDQGSTPDLRVISGMVWIAGATVKHGGPYLDEGTRRAMEAMAVAMTETMRVGGTGHYAQQGNWNNANQCCKGLEGLGDLYTGMRDPSDKTTVAANVRAAALGRDDGDITSSPPIWDPRSAFLRADGMVREGNRWDSLNPESDYLGRSWAHIFACLSVAGEEAELSWLRDWAKLLGEFVAANIFEEAPGEYHAPSGYSGRTSGAPVTLAQYSWFSNVAAAALLDTELMPFARSMRTGAAETYATLEAAVSAAVSAVNATTYGRGWSFRVNINGQELYRDWPSRSYKCVFAWPKELARSQSAEGWHAALQALVASADPSTYWLGTLNNWSNGVVTFPKTPGDEDFISIRAGSGDERWKALLQGNRVNGEYAGDKDGGMHLFWMWGYGGVICSHKPLKTKKYGFPSGEYPAPIFQDSETIICEYDTLVYGTQDGGPVLQSGGWAANAVQINDPSVRSCAWDGSELVTTQQIPPNQSYGFLSSGDSLASTKRYRVLSTAEDGMEGIECSVTLDYVSASPQTVLQLWHNLPCLVASTSNPSATLDFDYWTGSAWARVTPAQMDTWISGVQTIRLAKNKQDGAGERYAWIILDSARKVRFPTAESTPTGGRIKRLRISVHPGTEGVATELPAQTAYAWTVTSTDPGLVASTAVATLTAPAAATDRPFEGEPWMLAGSVAWGPKTPDNVVFEFSTDYAGDEGAATWNNIGTAAESGAVWTYYGGTVPSGVEAVRIKATASDASTATGLLAVLSKAPSAVVEDSFTGTNGTLITAHTPDTNTTGNSYTATYYSPDIQSNRADNTASAGKPDNGTFAAIDVGTDNWVVKGLVNTETANDSTKGPWLGMGVNRNTSYCRANVSSTGVHVHTRTNTGITAVVTSFTGYLPSASTDYQLHVQRIGSSFGFRLLSADGLTEHAKGAVHNIQTPAFDDGPGFGISRNGTVDDLEISV